MYQNLRAELARKGLTMTDVANELGVRLATISDKMNGKYPITLNEAKKIKRFLNVDLPLEELFKEVG